MGNASSRKGAQAERDIAATLTTILGVPIRRMLGAGRQDDIGDLHGLDDWTIQVANRKDLGGTLRHKPLGCEIQQGHAGNPFGATIMKLPPQPGGKPPEWRVVMTLDQWAAVVKILRIYEGRETHVD